VRCEDSKTDYGGATFFFFFLSRKLHSKWLRETRQASVNTRSRFLHPAGRYVKVKAVRRLWVSLRQIDPLRERSGEWWRQLLRLGCGLPLSHENLAESNWRNDRSAAKQRRRDNPFCNTIMNLIVAIKTI